MMQVRDKRATTQVDIHTLLANRWSPRSFKPDALTREQILALLEAARWTASSRNAQPYRFIVASKHDNPATYDRLGSTLKEGNQRWALDAPLLILAAAHIEDPDAPRLVALYDTGAAVAQLTTQAEAMGLGVRQMGGFYADQARAAFNIPADFEPMAVLAIGYRNSPDALPDDIREKEVAPRSRRPLHETVFTDTWGEPHPFVSGS